MMKKIIYLANISLLIAGSACAQTLDASFGKNGVIVRDEPHNYITSLAQQEDGKILALSSSSAGYAILRYNIDGSPDASFADNGILDRQFDSSWGDYGAKIIVQPDNKVLVVGNVGVGYDADFAIARFTSDYQIDSSFNGKGENRIDLGNRDQCWDAAIQKDGKILLCGNSGRNGGSATILRLNADGTVDKGFADDGIFALEYGYDYTLEFDAIKVKKSGEIVAFGNIDPFGSKHEFLTVQLKEDGSLDSSFADSGIVRMTFNGKGGFSNDLVIQDDGKIVLAGHSLFAGGILVRMNPDGTLDNSFGKGGIVFDSFTIGDVGYKDIEIDQNGKFYIGGYIYTSSFEDMFLIRYNNDGTIDQSYAPNGIITQLSPKSERIYTLKILRDGRVLAAGYTMFEPDYDDALSILCYLPYPLNIPKYQMGKDQLVLSPNPAIDRINISGFDEALNYSVYDISGKELLNGNLDPASKKSIDISSLSNGTYILHTETNQHTIPSITPFLKL